MGQTPYRALRVFFYSSTRARVLRCGSDNIVDVRIARNMAEIVTWLAQCGAIRPENNVIFQAELGRILGQINSYV